MRTIVAAIVLLSLCGCAQKGYDRDPQIVEMAKLAVFYRMTAPKTVVVGDEYEVTHEVGVK